MLEFLNCDSSFFSVVHSRNSSIPSNGSIQTRTNTDDDVSGQCSGASSRKPSRVNSRKNSYRPRKSSKNGGEVTSPDESPVIKVFRVAMLGASEVGKSALTSQFLSSDHMNTYDTVGKLYCTFVMMASMNINSCFEMFRTSYIFLISLIFRG